MPDLDALDYAILDRLQREGRASNAQLAEAVGLSETPCWRRVRKLEQSGLVAGYAARLDRRRLGFDVHAYVEVKFSTHDLVLSKEFEGAVQAVPEILSCHNVTGDVDYILTVVARNLDDYGRLTTVLRNLPGVMAIRSSLTLREVKAGGGLPLPEVPTA